jgi:hypothetical protein
MKEWQFDVLFVVGVGGALVMLFGPSLGLEIPDNPLAVGGVGAILTYVLTQRNKIMSNDKPDSKKEDEDGSS